MPSISWSGDYRFNLNAVAVREDTLRVKSLYRKGSEGVFRLFLPTLCITYADMKFQNQIGGEQAGYPDSKVYGPAYFDPPVVITGEKEVERLTYIRGATRVEIGPHDTVIEFFLYKELVIPRLRLSKKEPATLKLAVPPTQISVSEPLRIDIRQFADGRHVGGVRMEKRHPEWKPVPPREVYTLSVQVVDGKTNRPIPKAEVDVWHWLDKTGGFRLETQLFTDRHGCTRRLERPSGDLEAYVARVPAHRVTARCLRPLAGQKVRLLFRAWPLVKSLRPYLWRKDDTLEAIARFCGHSDAALLAANHVRKAVEFRPGMRVILPCWTATYRLESWDTLDGVAAAFGYKNAKGLAKALGVKEFRNVEEVLLPDWHFFYAGEKDTLAAIDRMFRLPRGSSRTVGRVYNPDPNKPYAGETIAVPAPGFFKVRPKGLAGAMRRR